MHPMRAGQEVAHHVNRIGQACRDCLIQQRAGFPRKRLAYQPPVCLVTSREGSDLHKVPLPAEQLRHSLVQGPAELW